MTLHMLPPKLPLPSDNERSLPTVTHDAAAKQKGTVLFKTLSPRKKIDQFGLDQTDYKAYCLSTTVFPTAVRATLLGELQESNPHACGFDIIDKPWSGEVPSCATSVINAPPPTAITSQRSVHSAPIVAFVEVPYSTDMAGTSLVSKSTANSRANSEVSVVKRDDPILSDHWGDSDHTENGLQISHKNTAMDGPVVRQQNSNKFGPRNSWSSGNGSHVVRSSHKFRKKSEKPVHAASPSRVSPRVTSYSRFDEDRLVRYQWKTREIRVEEDEKDGGDIRDTMYLNTFFPEERPVRFNKISLPRIHGVTRRRPWTVNESNVSARTAAMMNRQGNNSTHPARTTTSIQVFRRPSKGILKHHGGGVSKSAGHLALCQTAWRDGFNDDDDDDDGDNKENDTSLDRKPLLEIRSFLSSSAGSDQREKLKGKNGCLNSRVKQCIRFARYRERLDKQEENRPMKSENGKYRPFSKTDVREHSVSNPEQHTPEQKLQQSVETYQHYMENIARQANLSSPKHDFSFRGGSNTTSGFSRLRAPKIVNSSGFDADSLVVQSVMDSNRPDVTNGLPPSRPSTETPRPQHSAIYTKDVSAVGQALGIKRISPVPTVNRVVPGTRGVVQKSESPRVLSASSDECAGTAADDVLAPMSPHHGATIIVPNASKSECPSEYSVSKDD